MRFRLSFNFNQIEISPLKLEGKVPASAFDIFDEALVKYGEIEYQLEITSLSGGAILSGQISVQTKRKCSRCLSEFDYDIILNSLDHFYKKEIDKEFDLIPDLREDILIACPTNMICVDDCRGLCQICGANLNIRKCDCTKNNKEYKIAEGVWNGLDALKLTKNKKKQKGVSYGNAKKKKI